MLSPVGTVPGDRSQQSRAQREGPELGVFAALLFLVSLLVVIPAVIAVLGPMRVHTGSAFAHMPWRSLPFDAPLLVVIGFLLGTLLRRKRVGEAFIALALVAAFASWGLMMLGGASYS